MSNRKKKLKPRPSPDRNFPVNIRTASSRRRTMPVAVALITTIFIVFVLVHVGRSVHAYLSPDIAREMVQMGVAGSQQSVSGIIVRYENVFHAPRAGSVTFAVSETERVRPGIRVASISDSSAERISRNLEISMNEVMRLTDLRPYSQSDADVMRIDNNIRNAMNGNMRHFTELNLAEINRLQNNVSELTNVRFQMIVSGNHSAVGEAGRVYEQNRALQEYNVRHVYATRAGIMYNILDGFETELTPENMRNLSRDQVLMIVDHTALIPPHEVEEGDPIFKIVGNNWYIAALLPNDMIHGFEQGADVVIYVQNNENGEYDPLPVRIEYLERRALQNFVIFRSTRNVIGFLNQRNVSIRTTSDVSNGLVVSNSAITTNRFFRIPMTHVHGNEAVYRRTGEGLERVEIFIVDETDTYVYVLEETLALHIGDTLLPISINDQNFVVTESTVRTEHGVYLSTFGYASFTVVHLTGEPSDIVEYTLLDPARNPNLRQFDFIVTDASMVTHGQILR